MSVPVRWAAVVVAFALLVPAGSLGAAKKKKKSAKLAPESAQLSRVWPPPPQKERIRLLQVVTGERDVVPKRKRSFLSRLIAEPDTDDAIGFGRPYGLAGDGHGRLYVTDTYLRSIFVIDPQQRTFQVFAADSDVKFRQPVGIAVGIDERVWVADASLRSVLCFDREENLLLMFGTDPGTGESKNPTLQRPAGIALDEARKRVYVSDSKLNQIFVFDTKGNFITAFGKPGSDEGEFSFPGLLLVDASGQLLVADTMNARVQIFDSDYKLVQIVGERGDTPGSFARPKGMAFDSAGHLYVTDAVFNNFQIFGHDPRDAEPSKYSVLLFVGELGQKPGDFEVPGGIYIGPGDRIFVADQLNGRVQIFQFVNGD